VGKYDGTRFVGQIGDCVPGNRDKGTAEPQENKDAIAKSERDGGVLAN
jgi:hypothetical protein